MLDSIQKILLIQFRPFGDILLSTAYLEYLKQKFPNSHIHYLCNPPFESIIEEHPFVDKILTIPFIKGFWRYWQLKAWLKIRKEKYDLVIDQQSGTESKLFVLFSGAKYRLGWKEGKWSFLCNLKAPEAPHIYSPFRNLYMVRPLGIEADQIKLYVTISEKGKQIAHDFLEENQLFGKTIIGIEASCKDPDKRWHSAGFELFINKLLEKTDFYVLLLSAPAQRNDLDILSQKIASKRVLIAPPTPSMREAAAILEKINFLVCHEGALNHLSCATQTPALCLIGQTNHLIWSAQGFVKNHRHLKNLDWQNDGSNDFGIDADQVFAVFLEMMQALD